MFKKILVCSDGSDYARDAALVAVQVAAHFKAEVVALNVYSTYVAALGIFGAVKGSFTGAGAARSALQTTLVGGLAAAAAFIIARWIS